MSDVRKEVKDYYSNITVNEEGKMKTSICSCALENFPPHIQEIRNQIDPEIITHFYGCGSPIPLELTGCTVLDLGCGTGLDVYTLSKLVGEKGKVIGVDMNEDQLAIAEKHRDSMAEKFGFSKSNVEFKKGFIEDLKSLGIEDGSVDVVVSNCVINLSPNKEDVFKEIWRVLKNGGELYFSDIFADRRVPEDISNNKILRGECLGGAMYIEDFRRLLNKVGWKDFRYMSSTPAPINNFEIERLIGNIKFSSRTVRAFKLPDLIEDICEQYGQFAIYNGGIIGSEFSLKLDDHHTFEKGLPMSVCGNTCAMVENTRFSKYFTIYGNRDVHYGPFEGCGTSPSISQDDEGSCSGGSCCC
ncbi:methyltransferase domain-containing protein [Lagierella sp.]|uniref:methyltransferase domain-containing protein n=1 Tax=Lagierella sp. TaxID=2849657 RepID=UPI00260309AF|nr:methyltransferase domain-containing protein [Lagierella sp.]